MFAATLVILAGCGVLGGGDGARRPGRTPRHAAVEFPVRATVAGPGDLTGDGIDDLVVADETNGTLEVYAGWPGTPLVTPVEVLPVGDGLSPCRIAPAGDPFGTGRKHLLVQIAADCDEPENVVLLFEPTEDGLAPIWQAAAPAEVQNLGRDLAVGDINGDGFDDVVLGQEAMDDPWGTPYGGRIEAAVYPGSAEGLPPDAAWVRPVRRQGEHDGSAATTGGDFNGDGYADLVVSDIAVRGSCYRPYGSASAYAGGATGPEFEASWAMLEGAVGYDARLAGDIDGDGFDDVIMSTMCGGMGWGNTIFVVSGSAAGLTEPNEDPTWQLHDGYAYTDFAHDLDVADLDNDGLLDVLAATTDYRTVAQAGTGYDDHERGMGFLWLGSPDGFTECAPTVNDAIHPWPNTYLSAPQGGQGIRAVGDLDADGRQDVAVYGNEAYLYFNPPLETKCGPGGTEDGAPR